LASLVPLVPAAYDTLRARQREKCRSREALLYFRTLSPKFTLDSPAIAAHNGPVNVKRGMCCCCCCMARVAPEVPAPALYALIC